jgi:hypothetical protein
MVCPCEHQKVFFRQISYWEDLEQGLCQILGYDALLAAAAVLDRRATDQDIFKYSTGCPERTP